MVRKSENLEVELLLELKQWNKGLRQSENGLKKWGRAVSGPIGGISAAIGGIGSGILKVARIATYAAIGIGASMTAIATAGVHMAGQFEYAIAEVSTLLLDTSNFRHYRDQIVDLSYFTGERASAVAKAAYQTISAGFISAADSMEILSVASRAGIAGLTSTETAVRVLTGAVNAYSMTAKEAEHVADVLFTTVRLGVTTFGQLADSIGNVTTLASAAGVSFEEINAAIVALTKRGIRTRIAVIMLRTLLSSILSPAEKQLEVAHALGLEWNATALKGKGLLRFTQDMARATGGNIGLLMQLVPEIRAAAAVLTLAGEGAGEFNSAMIQMGSVSGAMGRAFEKMGLTWRFQFGRAKEAVRTMMIETFEPILPVITQIAKAAADKFKEVGHALRAFMQGLIKGMGWQDFVSQIETGTVESQLKEFKAMEAAARKAVRALAMSARRDPGFYEEIRTARKMLAEAGEKRRGLEGAMAEGKGKEWLEAERQRKRKAAGLKERKPSALDAEFMKLGEQAAGIVERLRALLIPVWHKMIRLATTLLEIVSEIGTRFVGALLEGKDIFTALHIALTGPEMEAAWKTLRGWGRELVDILEAYAIEAAKRVWKFMKEQALETAKGVTGWIAEKTKYKDYAEWVEQSTPTSAEPDEMNWLARHMYKGLMRGGGAEQRWLSGLSGPPAPQTALAGVSPGGAPLADVMQRIAETQAAGAARMEEVINVNTSIRGFAGEEMVNELVDKLVPKLRRLLFIGRLKEDKE
jgi:TP901 family phage tail tape measure protein